MSEICCAIMWPKGSYRGRKCTNTAKVEHEGKHYCGKHDPVAIVEREAAKTAERLSQWAKENAASKAKSAALAEQKRRADCYDDLLNELESVLDWAKTEKCALRQQEIESITRVVNKATGVKP